MEERLSGAGANGASGGHSGDGEFRQPNGDGGNSDGNGDGRAGGARGAVRDRRYELQRGRRGVDVVDGLAPW